MRRVRSATPPVRACGPRRPTLPASMLPTRNPTCPAGSPASSDRKYGSMPSTSGIPTRLSRCRPRRLEMKSIPRNTSPSFHAISFRSSIDRRPTLAPRQLGSRNRESGWRWALTRSRQQVFLGEVTRSLPRTPRIARMRLRSSFIVLALARPAAACGGSNSGGSNLTLNTGPAPWPNPDNVADRIDAAGLPSSSTESLTVHYHSHVDIFVDGKSEPVASSIGRRTRACSRRLHTHATSGADPHRGAGGAGLHRRDAVHGVGRAADERLHRRLLQPGHEARGLRGRHEVYTQPISTIVLEKWRGDRDRDRLCPPATIPRAGTVWPTSTLRSRTRRSAQTSASKSRRE